MIPFAAALAGAALVVGAAYLGGRARQMPVLPVAATFRAVGVASVPTAVSSDVATHRPQLRLVRYAARYVAPHAARHQGEGRATRHEAREAKVRQLVPNGIHRSSVAWAELDRQRVRFAALVRGGAR